jgi:pilus assembly protein Flp/PilA
MSRVSKLGVVNEIWSGESVPECRQGVECVNMWVSVARFLRDESGPTAVEYAVMLALVLMSIIAAISTFGGAAGAMFGNIDTQFSAKGLGS